MHLRDAFWVSQNDQMHLRDAFDLKFRILSTNSLVVKNDSREAFKRSASVEII